MGLDMTPLVMELVQAVIVKLIMPCDFRLYAPESVMSW
jgi:hypothetical protein